MAYYLDLFYGDPLKQGVSILSVLTGSALRPDVSSVMAVASYPTSNLINTSTILVTTASQKTVNITHVALYDAPTGGSLVDVAKLGASPTINKGNLVQFDGNALAFPIVPALVPVTITLSASLQFTFLLQANLTVTGGGAFGQWLFNQSTQSGEVLTCGIF